MTQPSIGDVMPDFEVQATGDKSLKLSDYRGKTVVLYFYPKDSTPGCTQEGQDFRDNIEKFTALNAIVLGVSRDSLKSHENFKCKQEFPFDLISDKDETLCQLFDVIKMKNMYGKQVQGIERSTFLIDPQGVLVHEWRKISVKGHCDQVLLALGELTLA
ncbi:peroxiredoxin [Methyloglobulus sp.]|uniref:peroxiredoxin n=1 Tax=Methyloglobulus sp. TaxID=2518622 RepID=UPI0032B8618A